MKSIKMISFLLIFEGVLTNFLPYASPNLFLQDNLKTMRNRGPKTDLEELSWGKWKYKLHRISNGDTIYPENQNLTISSIETHLEMKNVEVGIFSKF